MIEELRRSNLYKLREGLKELSDEDLDQSRGGDEPPHSQTTKTRSKDK